MDKKHLDPDSVLKGFIGQGKGIPGGSTQAYTSKRR